MPICSYCGYDNRPGTEFCVDCARRLEPEIIASETHTSIKKKMEELRRARKKKNIQTGASEVHEDTSILIYVSGAEQPLVFECVELTELVLGRVSGKYESQPDVDLTPYGALEKGVSRRHAMLNRVDNRLVLVDLNSTNGVWLNGKEISPDHTYTLHDGDEIRLNELVMHIYFE